MSISSYNQQEVSTWPLSDAGALTSIFNYMNYKTPDLRGRGFKSLCRLCFFFLEVHKLLAMANRWSSWCWLFVFAPHYVIAAEQIKVPNAYYKMADYSGYLKSTY